MKFEITGEFLRDWNDPDFAMSDLAIRHKVTVETLRRAKKQHRLPKRPKLSPEARRRSIYIPKTQEEIDRLTAEVRENWTEEDYRKRAGVGISPVYEVPELQSRDFLLRSRTMDD